MKRETQALSTTILRLQAAESEYRKALGSYREARRAELRRGTPLEEMPSPIVAGQDRLDIERSEFVFAGNLAIDRQAVLR
jgi:hypothetical protein